MKPLLIVILVIVLLGAGYVLFQNSSLLDNPPKTPGHINEHQDSKKAAFCSPSQLDGTMTPEVAAGNVYVQVMLKNISSSSCKVKGNNQLTVGYPNSVTNLKTDVKRQASRDELTLSPNQTIYALIHYPNGPQCSSMATDVNAMVSYTISDSESVTFTPSTGQTLDIPSCSVESEVTIIDLYAFSDSQVTP